MQKRGVSSSEERAAQAPLRLDRGTSSRYGRRPRKRGRQGGTTRSRPSASARVSVRGAPAADDERQRGVNADRVRCRVEAGSRSDAIESAATAVHETGKRGPVALLAEQKRLQPNAA